MVGAIPRSALDRLIATVLDGNLDLQAAAERVKQAQALTVQKRAVLLPELDATAHAVMHRTRRRRSAMCGRLARARVELVARCVRR